MPQAVIAGWSEEPGVTAYALVDEGPLIGYGELCIDDDRAEVELARLIVEPGHRGMGYGRRLVAEMVTLAQQHHPAVVMRLHPDNAPAERCSAMRQRASPRSALPRRPSGTSGSRSPTPG